MLGTLAILTMTVGNVVATAKIPKNVGLLSIAHAGNILVGLAIITELSVAGSILHIIAHGLMTIGIFFESFMPKLAI